MEKNEKIKEAARRMAGRDKDQAAAGTEERKKGVLVVIEDKPPVADNTTLMLYMVKLRAVDERQPTVYFSLGESDVQVVDRLIAIVTGIDLEKIVEGRLSSDEWQLVDRKISVLVDAQIYIDDTPEMTLDSLRTKLEGLAGKGVRLAVVDHARKVTAAGMDTDAVLDGIRTAAGELGITVFAVMD